MSNYKVLVIVSIFFLTGCVGYIPGMGGESFSLTEDTLSDAPTNENINAELSYADNSVTLNQAGNVEIFYLMSTSESGPIDVTPASDVSGGGTVFEVTEPGEYGIVGKMGEEYGVVLRFTVEEENNNNNSDNNSSGNMQQDEESDFFSKMEVNFEDKAVVTVGPSGEFNNIQQGIESANEFYTILVEPGTYNSFEVDKGVRVIGLGETIIQGGGDVGVKIESNDATINGFEIKGFETGMDIGKNSDVVIKNTKITDPPEVDFHPDGIDAEETYEPWVMDNVIVSGYGIGVQLTHSYSDWTIKNSAIINNHIGLRSQSGLIENNAIRNVNLENNARQGAWLSSSISSPDMGKIWYENSPRPDYMRGLSYSSCKDRTCEGSINYDDPSESVEVSDIELKTVSRQGGDTIVTFDPDVDILVVRGGTYSSMTVSEDVNIVSSGEVFISSDSVYCLEIEDEASPIIKGDFNLDGCGVNAIDSNGDWHIDGISIENANVGVYARESTGDWIIENSEIGASDTGISALRNTGSYVVMNTVISGADTGLSGDGSRIGNPILRYNSFENVETDFENEAARLDARRNWFGEDGPTVEDGSKVNFGYKCNEKSCIDQKRRSNYHTYQKELR